MATQISFFNNTSAPTSNQILLFLQPIAPQDDYLFSAWNVLNPSIGSTQSVTLSNTFSAGIATFGDTRGNFSSPVALPLGQALEITNPDSQSPVIGSPTSSVQLTPDQVGLFNNATTPPTDLSVQWYVNGSLAVQTNNTLTTTLNPGFASTFQLQQSIFCMLGQPPTITQTFTIQSFSTMSSFAVPNDATELNIEVFTNAQGIDTFQLLPPNLSFDQLVRDQRVRKSGRAA